MTQVMGSSTNLVWILLARSRRLTDSFTNHRLNNIQHEQRRL